MLAILQPRTVNGAAMKATSNTSVQRSIKSVGRRAFIGLLRLVCSPLSESQRFDLLTDAGRALAPRYRFKPPSMAWWDDQAFTEYLARFGELEFHNTDRRLAVAELLRLVACVEGDTAECGVFSGSTSYLICAANTQHAPGRIHHAFDSFEGLSAPGPRDGNYWSSGALRYGLDATRRNLSQLASACGTTKDGYRSDSPKSRTGDLRLSTWT